MAEHLGGGSDMVARSERSPEAEAMLWKLADTGVLVQASIATELGDLIATASDLCDLNAETNLRRLCYGFVTIANEISNLRQGSECGSLDEALERLGVYAKVCPPLTRQFLERVKDRELSAMKLLSRWRLPDDHFADSCAPCSAATHSTSKRATNSRQPSRATSRHRAASRKDKQ